MKLLWKSYYNKLYSRSWFPAPLLLIPTAQANCLPFLTSPAICVHLSMEASMAIS